MRPEWGESNTAGLVWLDGASTSKGGSKASVGESMAGIEPFVSRHVTLGI